MLLHEAQRSDAVRLTRALDIEVRRFQFEEGGQELCVVYVGAVGRVPVAPRTGVDPDPPPLFRREALEHPVVQVHEHLEQHFRWIELHCEAALGEIELHDVGALGQTTANVRLRLAHEILEKRFARVPRNAALRIEQAQRRGGDHRLLDGHVGVRSRASEV